MKVNPGAPPARPAAMVMAEKAMLLAEKENGKGAGPAAAADANADADVNSSSSGAAEVGWGFVRV